jgi:hypothetical protein
MAQRLATIAEVEAVFPGAVTMDPDTVALFMEAAGSTIDLGVWGSKASFGHAFLSAHFLAVAGNTVTGGGESGPLVTRTFDKMTEQYAVAATIVGTSGYSSTRFGRMYESMLASLVRCYGVAGRE